MRPFPSVPLSPCPRAYACLAAQGYDYLQEAFSFHLLPAFVDLLAASKKSAEILSDNLDATVPITLNGQTFQMHATGAKGGVKYRIEDGDILILVASPRRDWAISIRYKSAGLWEHGPDELRRRALQALAPYTRPRGTDYIRTTRVDYCFDFYSPTFATEFAPRIVESIVIHSSVKDNFAGKFDMWTRGPRGESLTIGSKSGLQIQIYDKTLEIIESSGKTWLHAVWATGIGGGFQWNEKPQYVYRLECRFSKGFLKDRNIRRPNDFKKAMHALIAEALYTRRLALKNETDSHRHRWPLHPLWSEAIRQCAVSAFVAYGRKVTERRVVLIEASVKAVAGSILAASVLTSGELSQSNVISFMERVQARINSDPRREQKVEKARNRYSDVDEAR
jgi:hypothetical protein